MASQGFYPVFIDGFSVTDPQTDKLVPRINAIYHMRDDDSPPSVYAEVEVGQDRLQYQAYFEEMVSKGYMPEIVSTYQPALQACFSKVTKQIFLVVMI